MSWSVTGSEMASFQSTRSKDRSETEKVVEFVGELHVFLPPKIRAAAAVVTCYAQRVCRDNVVRKTDYYPSARTTMGNRA